MARWVCDLASCEQLLAAVSYSAGSCWQHPVCWQLCRCGRDIHRRQPFVLSALSRQPMGAAVCSLSLLLCAAYCGHRVQ
eukprot:361458-Chlamydomonas_euryale.AAC.4